MVNIYLSGREVEKLSISERAAYFDRMRKTCLRMSRKRVGNQLIKKAVTGLIPHMRKYSLEIKGTENIPQDGNVLFLCNHSNARDFLTMWEVFSNIECNITFLASNEGISPVVRKLFTSCGGVLIDRNDKRSIEKGVMAFCANILSGMSGVIFGESTWNLHPNKPMQRIKVGAAHIAATTGIQIVPTIFEYMEVPEVCAREQDIYRQCVVQFSSPVNITENESLFKQTDRLQKIMEQEREGLWEELGIERKSLEDMDRDVYLNHTYLKKYDAIGFVYDSCYEMKFLLSKREEAENEYCLDNEGNFTAGVIWKDDREKCLL